MSLPRYYLKDLTYHQYLGFPNAWWSKPNMYRTKPFLVTKFDCIALDAASMYFQVAFRGPWKLGLKTMIYMKMAAVHSSQCAVFFGTPYKINKYILYQTLIGTPCLDMQTFLAWFHHILNKFKFVLIQGVSYWNVRF